MSRVPVLFDVNACFGKKSAGSTEFRTLRERLDFMDRFGISRAVVWNVEAVQNHAQSSSRRLMDAMAATPGARGRIVPALSVSGLMHYERGGIDELVEQMEATGTRALRFANVFGRLTLTQLEPVMRRVRRLRPFLVLRHDQATPADILAFTDRFPDIPLVLTEVMWGPCITVFDLMRQRKSILVDTSWMHSYGAIEMVVKHFGAESLVFGTGTQSHNGAAVAALARADITEAQRRLIAHGNLDRLTGLKTRPADRAGRRTPRNTLWPRFLEGKPVGVDVVDAHGHLGPSGGYVLADHEEKRQAAVAVEAMDACGIATMMVSGMQALMGGPVEGNALLESVLRPYGRRFAGYVAFNPFYADELVPRLDRYFRGPFFVGFKTLCDYWAVPITDARFTPMWEYAERHRLPVLSHTWGGGNDSPAMFADLARRYPHVAFLLGHSGGGDGGRREAEELATKRRNVYLEWCGSFCSTICWEESFRQGVPPGQVVFGTDAMAHDIHWELGRLLSLDVPDKVLVPILGGTMRRLLAGRRG